MSIILNEKKFLDSEKNQSYLSINSKRLRKLKIELSKNLPEVKMLLSILIIESSENCEFQQCCQENIFLTALL